MNVKDVASIPAPVDGKIQAQYILDRQAVLEETYWEIEGRYAQYIGINEAKGQVIIKDFLWRITEEIGEAIEAIHNQEAREKFVEEIADALHFVAGLCVILRRGYIFTECWNSAYLPAFYTSNHNNNLALCIKHLGILGNTLKLKPWKQTAVLTDEVHFDFCLKEMIRHFLGYCAALEIKRDELWDYYYRKSEVNLFRIRSKY